MATDEERRRVAARPAAAVPAGGLRGHLRGDGGAAGDDPPARSAAARVPARPRRPAADEIESRPRGGQAAGRDRRAGADRRPRAGAGRAESDAGHPRLPAGASMHPEIYEMQVRAIVRAALGGRGRGVEIMHPLVGFAEELRRLRALTEDVIEQEGGRRLGIHIGTMIEVPRAALTADEIAERGRLLLVRHQRPDPDDAGILARRRRGQVPDALPGGRRAGPQPVRDARPARRGPADRARGRAGPRRAARTSSSASAASTAATPTRSRSATAPASTTCRARRSGCRSRGWRPPRRRCARTDARAGDEDRRRLHAGRARRRLGGGRDRRAAGDHHHRLRAGAGLPAGAGLRRARPGARAGGAGQRRRRAGGRAQVREAGGVRPGQLAARVRRRRRWARRS